MAGRTRLELDDGSAGQRNTSKYGTAGGDGSYVVEGVRHKAVSRAERVTETLGGLFGAAPGDAKRWETGGTYQQGRKGYHKLAAYEVEDGVPGNVRQERRERAPPGMQRGRTREREKRRPRLPAWRRASVKRRLDALPTFRPYFIWLITLVQVAVTIYVLVDSGLAPIAIEPKKREQLINDTLSGDAVNVVSETPVNFMLGPEAKHLVRSGAKFTLCMRKDTALLTRMARDASKENGLRCCQSSQAGGNPQCGMIEPEDCLQAPVLGTVLGSATQCNSSLPACSGGVTLRPCCVGLNAGCIITTQQNCSFQGGYWHPERVLCRDVNCLGDVCRMDIESSQVTPADANQWYRFFTAIILQSGIVPGVIFLALQLQMGADIERQIGWLRIMLIYVISGVGGFLTSAIFDPDTAQVGANGALFGLFSIKFVELMQKWQVVHKACSKLFGLLITLTLTLAIGTTPYLDNFANVGGFLCGLVSSVIFVPYITFGKFDAARKCCFVLVALPLLGFIFLVGFVVFYNTQNTNFCSWCKYINCVPYTDKFCEEGFNVLKIRQP